MTLVVMNRIIIKDCYKQFKVIHTLSDSMFPNGRVVGYVKHHSVVLCKQNSIQYYETVSSDRREVYYPILSKKPFLRKIKGYIVERDSDDYIAYC